MISIVLIFQRDEIEDKLNSDVAKVVRLNVQRRSEDYF